MKSKALLGGVALLVIAGGAWLALRAFTARDENTPRQESVPGQLDTMATDLDTPWDIAFLPNGDMLVTERSGQLHRYGSTTYSTSVPDVRERGEGGLLGIAVHPDYERNNYIYLYFTTERDGATINRIARYVLDTQLSFDRVIVDDIPGGSNHNGGRIAFGPDGILYATTGDSGVEERAQDRESLAGKILRMHDDGAMPGDNPFGTLVWSWGHRNSQGLAWDEDGRLWETEHGRSGPASGYDELNLIEKGGNYGWPIIQGDETREGMRAPALHSGPSTTWAPCGIAFSDGKLHFAGLRGQALYSVSVENDGTLGTLVAGYGGEFGRLRAVSARDGAIYFSTSNKDGRGKARPGDDRIVRLTL